MTGVLSGGKFLLRKMSGGCPGAVFPGEVSSGENVYGNFPESNLSRRKCLALADRHTYTDRQTETVFEWLYY